MFHEGLLVIDMDKNFLRDKKTDDLRKKLEVQGRIIRSLRQKGATVIYTADTYTDDVRGKITDPIQPLKSEQIIQKPFSDAFEMTNLYNHMNVHILHIIGCNAEYCVKESVDSAVQLGYKVVVYKNAVLSGGSSRKRLGNMFLRWALNPCIDLLNWTEK